MTGERSRTETVAWIAAGAVLLLLAWKLLTPPGGGGGGAPVGVSRPAAARSGTPGHLLYVHVAGSVRRPGLYRLAAGSRIAAALDRAGGPVHGADLSAVNLAMRVQDGQQIMVPRRGAAPAAASGAGEPGATGGARPSLATATVEQLDQLEGIGPTTAQKILDWRREHGGFRSVDDLNQISGIGPKRFESLKDKVRM
jgi:competence protein ComEA